LKISTSSRKTSNRRDVVPDSGTPTLHAISRRQVTEADDEPIRIRCVGEALRPTPHAHQTRAEYSAYLRMVYKSWYHCLTASLSHYFYLLGNHNLLSLLELLPRLYLLRQQHGQRGQIHLESGGGCGARAFLAPFHQQNTQYRIRRSIFEL
jgi:hypothetical protein